MAGIKLKSENPGNGLSEKKDTAGVVIAFLNRDIRIFGKQLRDKKKYNLYLDLHVLLSSGIDIKSSLDIICDDAVKKEETTLLNTLKKHIADGKGLSDAMALSKKFSPYEVHSICIGEESGQLVQVIKNLCEYFSKKIEQKRKIISAFTYPSIVMATAILAIAFMLNYIVPMFEDVFKRFNNKELPGITKFIIRLSSFFSGNFAIGILLMMIIFIFVLLVRKKSWYRDFSSRLLLRIPIFGEIFRKIYLARFCMAMELLAGAKVPLINAIRLVKKMTGFYPIETSLGHIENKLTHGTPLHECLAGYKIYDKRMISLVKVAEEVNQLQEVFGKLKKQYNDDIDYRSNNISSLLEPVMIIIIGLFVGIVLIAMYLPMFQLSTNIAE